MAVLPACALVGEWGHVPTLLEMVGGLCDKFTKNSASLLQRLKYPIFLLELKISIHSACDVAVGELTRA